MFIVKLLAMMNATKNTEDFVLNEIKCNSPKKLNSSYNSKHGKNSNLSLHWDKGCEKASIINPLLNEFPSTSEAKCEIGVR